MKSNNIPSKTKDAYWVSADSSSTFYSSEFSGKWCIFVDSDEVDQVWAEISRQTELDNLLFAKASTAAGHSENSQTHVICVYTQDYRNTEEIMRARNILRESGISGLMKYKRDIDTLYPPTDPDFEFFYIEFR